MTLVVVQIGSQPRPFIEWGQGTLGPWLVWIGSGLKPTFCTTWETKWREGTHSNIRTQGRRRVFFVVGFFLEVASLTQQLKELQTEQEEQEG